MQSKNQLLEHLKHCRLFADYELAELIKFAEYGEQKSIAKGEQLLLEGQDNQLLYIVLSGELDVFLPASKKMRISRVSIGQLYAGDCVGEYSFIDGFPVTADVAAVEPTEVFCLSRDRFDEFAEHQPNLAILFYQQLVIGLIAKLRRTNLELDMVQYL